MVELSSHVQLSSLHPSLYPYVTHVINYPWPSPSFSVLQDTKAGQQPHNEASHMLYMKKGHDTQFLFIILVSSTSQNDKITHDDFARLA